MADYLQQLRVRVEAKIEFEDASDRSPDEIRRMLHELRTHQIELEMQKEELRRSQEELLESRDRYADLYDLAPVGYITLSENGLILESNLRAAGMLGVERSRAQDRPLSDFILPEDQDVFYRHRLDLLEDPARYSCEFRLERADTDPRWVRLESLATTDAERGGRQIRSVMSDVSKLRQAEDEQSRLEHERLESLGLMAGGIAHDFNNLLTAVMGHASAALTKLPPDSPVHKSLEEIERASLQGAELCAQMLAYAGQRRLVPQGIDLSALAREVVHLLKLSVAKEAHVELDLASDLPTVVADASQIRQIVMNLVTNASEALGEGGGRITISTRVMERNRAALEGGHLYGELPAESVCLEVIDTGCGMDGPLLAKIFDPFFTTKFTGRGLGLAAVLGILRSHRGAATVRSAPDEGATFRVFLATSDRPVLEEPADVTARVGTTTTDSTVLVVDDEEIIRSLLRGVLEDAGFEVLVARGGGEAVEIFREHGDEIALVLLDLTMPHMSGEEAFRRLKRIRNDVRVVISSGYSESGVAERFAGLGLAGFIHKPYRSEDLIEKLRGVLDPH